MGAGPNLQRTFTIGLELKESALATGRFSHLKTLLEMQMHTQTKRFKRTGRGTDRKAQTDPGKKSGQLSLASRQPRCRPNGSPHDKILFFQVKLRYKGRACDGLHWPERNVLVTQNADGPHKASNVANNFSLLKFAGISCKFLYDSSASKSMSQRS